MKKILIVVVDIQNGGIESFLSNVLSNIDKSNLIIDIAYNRVSNNSVFFNNIKKRVRNSFSYGGSFCWSPYFHLLKLFYICKHGHYDVIHVNSGVFNGAVLFLAKINGIKSRISHVHVDGFKILSIKDFIKYPLKFFIKYLATRYIAVSFKSGKNFYGNKPFLILKNGVDINMFKFNMENRNKIRNKLKIEDKFIVGHVGRFCTEKNHKFLVEIFNEIYKQKNNSVLLLIGTGPLREEIEEKVNKLNLINNVIFIGNKSNVYEYYQAMDCFILPSLHEGLPFVSIEAQCSGLPCFISDGVPDEAMICNITKISLNKSAKEWANIILEKIKNFKRNEKSSKFIEKAGFDIKDTARQMEQILNE